MKQMETSHPQLRADVEEGELHVDAMHDVLDRHMIALDIHVTNFIEVVTEI